ncbi:hypothetical protein [Pedobacter sp. MC2016-24]|uniref:hypothetical protein n=1 Tax=Pedobacter sp. MC2016-24 TaxID=2780090 RepID=UPI0018822AFA|nr:hypothetical protein [Pedobacter sp. MC2016-24]MBE9602973.1 hypothetical protein [Pedobacter sp. MC2016-24]
MEKLTIIVVMAMLCLNFNVLAQKKDCNIQLVSNCKWGFSGFKTGFASYSKITPSRFAQWRRLVVYNKTLPEMFSIALRALDCDILIAVKDPEKLTTKYCYELNTPPELVDDIFVIMHKHLNYQYPDYVASIEYKNGKNYLVISDKEDGILLQTPKNTTY